MKLRCLTKALKCAPKKNLNNFNTYVDINKFSRSLHTSKPGEGITRSAPDTNGILFSNVRNKSLFNPPIGNDGHIEVFSKNGS